MRTEPSYGNPGDILFAGDWNGNGVDTVAVYRPTTRVLYVKNSNEAGAADHTVEVGDFVAGFATTTTTVPPPPTPSNWSPPPEPPVPPIDAEIYPSDDPQAVINAHPTGTTFLVKSGIHRLWRVVPKSGQTFVGEPGAVVSGAKVLDSFEKRGAFWVATGQTQQGSRVGQCVAGVTSCIYPEDLFFDNVLLTQVTSASALEPGSWFFNYDTDEIHLADDPTGHLIETSVEKMAFSGSAQNVEVRSLIIEKYATPAQSAAIGVGAQFWVIQHNEVRFNHGIGIGTWNNNVIRANYVHHNGQMGMGGQGSNVIVEFNEIAHNNTAGYNSLWEAGGTKFVKTVNLIVRGNYSHHNNGPGLWTDIDNIDTLYEDNVVMFNADAGIFHEISYDAVIRNNYVEGNGTVHQGAGILVSESPRVEVYGNTVIGAPNSIMTWNQDRGSGAYGPHETRDVYVHDNHIELATGHTGMAHRVGDNVRYDHNTYLIDSANAQPFSLPQQGRISRTEWQAAGQDINSVWN